MQQIVQSAHLGLGRKDLSDLADRGRAVRLQEGHDCFRGLQLLQCGGGIERGVLPERGSRRLDPLLLRGSVGSEGVLDLVSQLGQDRARNIAGILGDVEYADPLGADQLHHLLDLFQERLGRTVKEQVRLVEEEHHLRLRQVAHLRHHVEELRHQPEHEGGVDRRVVDQGGRVEDIDHTPAFSVCPEEIADLQRGLSEELFPAASLQGHKGAHDDADALGADVPVLFPVNCRVVADIVQHRLQILEIQEKHAFIVRDPEDNVQQVGLGLVQLQKSCEQERAELGDCGPESQAPFSHDVPERRRICLVAESRFRKTKPLYPLLHVLAVDSGPAHAGQIALDI